MTARSFAISAQRPWRSRSPRGMSRRFEPIAPIGCRSRDNLRHACVATVSRAETVATSATPRAGTSSHSPAVESQLVRRPASSSFAVSGSYKDRNPEDGPSLSATVTCEGYTARATFDSVDLVIREATDDE